MQPHQSIHQSAKPPCLVGFLARIPRQAAVGRILAPAHILRQPSLQCCASNPLLRSNGTTANKHSRLTLALQKQGDIEAISPVGHSIRTRRRHNDCAQAMGLILRRNRSAGVPEHSCRQDLLDCHRTFDQIRCRENHRVAFGLERPEWLGAKAMQG